MSEGGEGYQPTQLPEVQQHEPLTDVQIGDLISSAGNHEGKALTVVAMEPGEIYTYTQLHKSLLEIQGDKPGWEITNSVPFDWCKKSLGPIGLVAQEVIDNQNNNYGYTLTEYGETIGKPFAGLLLDWSRKHPNISLNQLFASSMVSQKWADQSENVQNRAPITRYKLLWELVTSDLPLRSTDISKALDLNKSILGRHLQDLADNGIIEYSVVADIGKPYLQYKFDSEVTIEMVDKAIQEDKTGNRTFTKELYATLSAEPNKTWTRDELKQKLISPTLKNQEGKLSTAIGVLKKSGALQAIEFDYGQFSRIDMTPEQRDAIVELLETINSFQKQDLETVEKGNELVKYFNTHPLEVAQLMSKIREASSNANQISASLGINMLNSIIESSPNTDVTNIQQLLKDKFHKSLSRARIMELLNQAAAEGKFVRTDNRNSYWNIAANPSSDSPEEHSATSRQLLEDLSRQ